jgi:hypothetical protein
MFVVIITWEAVATLNATSEEDNRRYQSTIPFPCNTRRATTSCLMARRLDTVRDSRHARIYVVTLRDTSL